LTTHVRSVHSISFRSCLQTTKRPKGATSAFYRANLDPVPNRSNLAVCGLLPDCAIRRKVLPQTSFPGGRHLR
jgi:hypothetical protein